LPWSPEDSLVIGISSRALFKLDEENAIYKTAGTQAFIDYQREYEGRIIEPGVAFPLVTELLKLNEKLTTGTQPAIEIVIVSKNHPDCGIRMRRSLKEHGLEIRRAVFTGGQDTLPSLRAFKVDLFLSKEEAAVRNAIANKISAGLIHGGPERPEPLDGTPIFAFDGDSVLFSEDADQIFKEKQLAGFEAYEYDNLGTALPPGPLHTFAKALEELRAGHPIDHPPFRIALVTARALSYSERPLRTFREQGIRVDMSFFLDGMSKGPLLSELKPLIFFDDSLKNCDDACQSTPTARVPVQEKAKLVITLSSGRAARSHDRLLRICKLYLKKDFAKHESTLRVWQEENLSGLSDEAFENFAKELERSASGTPKGKQRRAGGEKNEDYIKLLSFLEDLKRKYSI
jgi:5'-nucleotidase